MGLVPITAKCFSAERSPQLVQSSKKFRGVKAMEAVHHSGARDVGMDVAQVSTHLVRIT